MPRKTRSAPPLAGVLVLDTGAANVHISCSEGHKDDVCTMPNAIARTRQGVRRQILVGDCIETECQDYGELQLRLPMDRGMVVDWAAQKSVWDRALARTLGCGSDTFGALHGRSVIMTEPYFALPEQQKAFDMLMFEWYEAELIWRTIRTYGKLAPTWIRARQESLSTCVLTMFMCSCPAGALVFNTTKA